MKHKSSSNGFFSNWQVKIVCLILAVLIYFAFAVGMPGERKIKMPLNLILPEGFNVTSLIPSDAEVVIRGEEGKIYMVDVNRIKLVADFSDVKTAGVASVPVVIDYQELLDYIDVTDLTIYTNPANIKLYFE